jgi:hypothetical protein
MMKISGDVQGEDWESSATFEFPKTVLVRGDNM